MVCVPSCTHGIIKSLWLKYYIQCGFSISYLSTTGIAAHDRCNICRTSTFSFQFQCLAVSFVYITVFREDSKRGGVVGGVGS